MRVVVLFSGRGSNFDALCNPIFRNWDSSENHIPTKLGSPYQKDQTREDLAACTRPYEIVAAITDGYSEPQTFNQNLNGDGFNGDKAKTFHPPLGIQVAEKWNVPCISLPRTRGALGKFSESKATYHQRLAAKIVSLQPDLVVLAGFMQLLTPELVQALTPNLINIHPSLLPEFPGLDTHSRALEKFQAGEIIRHGVTVHQVDEGMDSGPIIAQMGLKISSSDDAESLARKVLNLEHIIYPYIVTEIANGKICLSSKTVTPIVLQKAAQMGIEIKFEVR